MPGAVLGNLHLDARNGRKNGYRYGSTSLRLLVDFSL